MAVNTRIQKLDPYLINQIAAGEVIARPSSVVKECLENSFDAKATQVSIEVEHGGKRRICIRDNGCGIEKDDLGLALTSHATSKLGIHPSFDQLQDIVSLGFRGEALASISAVSRLKLTSKTLLNSNAWSVFVEGREMTPKIIPAAHPQGTTIDVCNLFFNVPARRKFMRSDRSEFLQIEDCVKRLALSNFSRSLDLHHNGKATLQLKSATTDAQIEQRIARVCGQNFVKNALRVDSESSGVSLSGWCGDPERARSQSDQQYFFVNHRMIRDKFIQHAIRQSYGDLLYAGRHPVYILYLEIEPEQVDVNVHPTKHEVRFHGPRLIHDFITRTLTKRLHGTTFSSTPSLNPIRKPSVPYQSSSDASSSLSIQSDRSEYDMQLPRSEGLQIQQTPNRALAHSFHSIDSFSLEPDASNFEVLSKAAPMDSSLQVIGQLKHRYALLETKNGLLMVDMRRVNQKYYYELLSTAYQAKNMCTKPLLLPIPLTLTAQAYEQLEHNTSYLSPFGFECAVTGECQIVLKKVPALLVGEQLEASVMNILMKALLSEKETDLKLHLIAESASMNIPVMDIHQLEQWVTTRINDLGALVKKQQVAREWTLSDLERQFTIPEGFQNTMQRSRSQEYHPPRGLVS